MREPDDLQPPDGVEGAPPRRRGLRSERKVEVRLPRLERTAKEKEATLRRRATIDARVVAVARGLAEESTWPSVEAIVDSDPGLAPASVRRRMELLRPIKAEFVRKHGSNRYWEAEEKRRAAKEAVPGSGGETPDGAYSREADAGPARPGAKPDLTPEVTALLTRLRRELDTCIASRKALQHEILDLKEQVRRLEKALDARD